MSIGETAGRTSAKEARRLIGTGKAKALDLRGEDEWQDSHLPGALHVPSAELGSRIEELSEHKRQILVGADDEVEREIEELNAQGHEATALEGGMNSWESEDFPRGVDSNGHAIPGTAQCSVAHGRRDARAQRRQPQPSREPGGGDEGPGAGKLAEVAWLAGNSGRRYRRRRGACGR